MNFLRKCADSSVCLIISFLPRQELLFAIRMTKYIFRHINAWYWYVVIICLVPFPCFSQTLSINDAVDKAIINYPQLKQREAEISAGNAHIKTVKGGRLPSLILQDQMNLGTDNSLQGAYFSLGMIPSTPGNYLTVHNEPIAGNTAISFLKWDFLTFGYYNAQQNEANAALAVTEALRDNDKYVLTENTITYYLDWLKKYMLLNAEAQNVERSKVILRSIEAIVRSGLKPGVDSSTAHATYSDARLSYLQALDNYNNARILIALYTGLSTNIAPDTTLFSQQMLRDIAQFNFIDTLTSDHPLLQPYEKLYQQQLAGRSVIAHKYLPRLGLDAAGWVRNSGISYNGVYPAELSTAMPYSRYNYLLGLTLTYNLVDLKHRKDELTESSYLVEAKSRLLETRELDLSRSIQQVNSTYSSVKEKLNEIPVLLRSAEQAYGQQVALYKTGLNTLTDVTNAQYALRRAETNYVATQFELLQLMSVRAGLSGQLNNFLQTFKR